MAEIIGAKVQLDAGDAVKNTGTLRQQLKAALIDLQSMQEQFGDISPEAIKAAQSVAGLRDAIKDANEVSELFNPEKKFQAFVNVAQGIASGFAAAQGAMALFGAQSEDVEKALLKVQSAMALAQGLAGLRAASEDFTRLAGTVANLSIVQKANNAINVAAAGIMRALGIATETTSLAFNTLKAAIITTGIGALVVAVGIAIQKISSLGDATGEAAKAQKELNDELERTANTFTDEIVDIYEQNRQLQIARAKAAGATEAEIVEINRKANEEITAERARNLSQQKVNGQEAADAQKAYNKQVTDNELYELGVRQKNREDAEKKQEEADKKRKENQDKADALAKQQAAEKEANVQKLGELFKTSLENEDQAIIDSNERKKEQDDAYIAYQSQQGAAQFKAKEERTAAEIELDQKKRNAQIGAAQAVAGALNGFAALAGEQTAAGKTFAVASATIQAILGAQQAFTSLSSIPIVGPALGAVAAAGAIAAGIANVKKILAVKVPGQSGGGGGSVPSIATAAPLSPTAPTITPTKLDQESINNIGNAIPVRAYVVESDITQSQNRMNRIQNAAKFK